ncbi:hypothetical protein D3C72_1250160 [compost metagenome]
MIETVGFQEHVFPGEAQVGPLHEVVFVAGVLEDIAETNILREEARHRRGGVTLERRKQRNTALRGDHPGDGVIGARQLRRVAEI